MEAPPSGLLFPPEGVVRRMRPRDGGGDFALESAGEVAGHRIKVRAHVDADGAEVLGIGAKCFHGFARLQRAVIREVVVPGGWCTLIDIPFALEGGRRLHFQRKGAAHYRQGDGEDGQNLFFHFEKFR